MKPPERIWIDDSYWYTHSKADADDEKRHEYILASSAQELVEAAKAFVKSEQDLRDVTINTSRSARGKRLKTALERMEGKS
jgi:hypothetical protein